MFEYLTHLFNEIPLMHLNVLLILGIVLFGGLAGGRLFQKFRVPQVVGYIIIGILLGKSGLRLINDEIMLSFRPFNYFALGLIGFMVGGELKRESFAKYGKDFLYILCCEGITPFILVTLFGGIIGSLLFGAKPFVWGLSLLLGAIASATDPATTTSVLKEYKTKGPLTTNILGIVALDDGLALLLFAIASSVAGALIGRGGEGIISAIIHPLYEIGGAVLVGVISGAVLNALLVRYGDKDRVLVFSIGTVLFVTGISLTLHISMLLAAMMLGVVVVNTRPHKSKEVFNLVEAFTPPIFVMFFVLVGSRLHFSHITFSVLILILTYLLFGLSGKMIGAKIGALLSKSPKTVSNYLPFSLFSQAGVAIGLSILAAQHFEGEIGYTLIIVITATTFATQIIGPPMTKYAVTKAEEVGLNITEEDIAEQNKARDAMDANPPLIYENMPLRNILQIFSDYDNLYYPVVNKEKLLQGVVTVEGIKHTLLETDTEGLILANDLMQPVIATALPDVSVSEIKELLNRYAIDYLPIINNDGRLEGFIERKMLNKYISTKMIELQRRLDTLGSRS
jgi:Kef-type K+ transport system membrane component KefB/CBS domain-containing protein